MPLRTARLRTVRLYKSEEGETVRVLAMRKSRPRRVEQHAERQQAEQQAGQRAGQQQQAEQQAEPREDRQQQGEQQAEHSNTTLDPDSTLAALCDVDHGRTDLDRILEELDAVECGAIQKPKPKPKPKQKAKNWLPIIFHAD